MKRTAILRRSDGSSRLSVKAPKPKKCPECFEPFTPTRGALQPVCPKYACNVSYAEKLIAKKQANREREARRQQAEERKADRTKRESLKKISELEEECRRIVQKMARIRDRNDGCISCELPANWDGQWHGSHYRSVGACSALQFHLWNINKACWICNKLYSGRINQYEPKLIAKIGQDKVDWLKAQNKYTKHPREYLIRFKKVMGKRLRRMEKRI